MPKVKYFFDEYEKEIQQLTVQFHQYRDGIFEDPENILDLIECTCERLFADIVYHKAKRNFEEKLRGIKTEMEIKAKKEVDE